MSSFARAREIPQYVQENYLVDNEIAKGKYGVVYRCKEKANGQDVAVKVMMKRHNKKEDVEREVAILKELQHPNLLQFVDYTPDGTNFILVTELLNGGELFDYCVSKDYLDENEAIFFVKQILDGLNYMHSRSICHLDLKPENMVLKSIDTREIKIIDFGTAQNLSKTKDVKAMAGTPEFISPEVLNYDPVTCAADMWAVGAITFCLLTGFSPFLGENDCETIQNVTLVDYEFPDPEPEDGYNDISQGAKDFINRLLILAPRKRMSSAESLDHSWLKNVSTSRISTDRLKKLRRRRKLMAAMQAVRLSVGLFRTFSTIGKTAAVPEATASKSATLGGSRRSTEPYISSNLSSSVPSSSSPMKYTLSTNGATSPNGISSPDSFSDSPFSPLHEDPA